MTTSKPELTAHGDGLQYKFGPFCLRPDGTLLRNLTVISLPPKELAILRLLVSNAGRVVSAEQLRLSAWGNVHVSADSLPRCVSSLRARLEREDCIQTVYKRGYRFNLAVEQGRLQDQAKKWVERRTARPNALPRLAILPFTTAYGVPESFGPGIAEQTMLRLSQTRNEAMEILARDSVFTLAVRGATAQDVGRTLNADLALVGSITALPLHFRLRAEMIRVASGVQLWVEDFLVPRALLAYADIRMAKRITARIRATFAGPVAPVTVASVMTVSDEVQRSDAYKIYMQACADWNTLERHHMQDAIQGFQRTLELDPTMLSARTYLMHGYLSQSSFGYMRGDVAADLARKQAEIILSQSSHEQSVHPALGWIYAYRDRDFAAASDAFARPQFPSYTPWALVYQIRFAISRRRFHEAISLLRSALTVDPYSAVVHGRLAWALYLASDTAAALEQAKRAISLFPNHPSVLFFCSNIFAASVRSGDPDNELAGQATTLAARLVKRAPSLDAGYTTLAYTHAKQGRIAEANTLLERQQWLSSERFVMRIFQAPVLVELGEYDAALEELAIAEEQYSPWLFELLADPRLQPLRGNPEFQRLNSLSRQGATVDASVA